MKCLVDHGRRTEKDLSPSSRRAWIEMYIIDDVDKWDDVALLAEGVD